MTAMFFAKLTVVLGVLLLLGALFLPRTRRGLIVVDTVGAATILSAIAFFWTAV